MSARHAQNGFSLLEVITILLLIGVVASFVVSFMGRKISNAPDVAVIAQQEAQVERLMEHIIADYLNEINGANPDGALAAVVGREATYEALDPSGNTDVEFEYITFSAGGAEQAGAATDPTLKVTVFTAGNGGEEQHRLTTLLTESRTTAGAEDVVNY